MLASSISQGLVRGGQGLCAGAPHGLQLGFGCQVICVLLLLSDSSRCDFIPALPLPLALVSMLYVFVFPLTCQCDGARWVAVTHRVVMDTLCVRRSLIRGLTLLSRHHSPSLSIVDEFKQGLQMTNSRNLGKTFQDKQTVL